MTNSSDAASIRFPDDDDEEEYPPLLPMPWLLVTVVCVTVAIATAVGGNLLVLLSYWRDVQLRNVHNLYLLHLAVCDLLIGTISMPLYLVYTVRYWRWPLGVAMCRMFLVEDNVVCTMTTLVVVLVAWDRLTLVTVGARYHVMETKKRAYIKLAACWIYSCVLYAPPTLLGPEIRGYSVVPDNDCDIEFNDVLVFVFVYETMGFSMPFVSLTVINTLLGLALKKRNKVNQSLTHVTYHDAGGSGASVVKSGQILEEDRQNSKLQLQVLNHRTYRNTEPPSLSERNFGEVVTPSTMVAMPPQFSKSTTKILPFQISEITTTAEPSKLSEITTVAEPSQTSEITKGIMPSQPSESNVMKTVPPDLKLRMVSQSLTTSSQTPKTCSVREGTSANMSFNHLHKSSLSHTEYTCQSHDSHPASQTMVPTSQSQTSLPSQSTMSKNPSNTSFLTQNAVSMSTSQSQTSLSSQGVASANQSQISLVTQGTVLTSQTLTLLFLHDTVSGNKSHMTPPLQNSVSTNQSQKCLQGSAPINQSQTSSSLRSMTPNQSQTFFHQATILHSQSQSSSSNQAALATSASSGAPKSGQSVKGGARSKAERRVLLILLSLVLALIVFWLPYGISTIVLAACHHCVDKNMYEFFNWLLWLKSCVNPFLYAFNSPRFRRNIQDLLGPVLPVRWRRTGRTSAGTRSTLELVS